jgi:signal transduction histidine kinase
VILSGLQTLEELGADLTEDERQSIVRHGIMAGERTMTLISSLIDPARLESGKMPLQVQDLEVKELVGSSLEEMKPWAEQRHLTLPIAGCRIGHRHPQQLQTRQEGPSSELSALSCEGTYHYIHFGEES